MLIEAPLKDGDTVTIKTFNGDELIARLVETKANTYVVSNYGNTSGNRLRSVFIHS